MGSQGNDVIDLFRGHPDPSLLPMSAIAKASATVMATPDVRAQAMLYGPDEGYGPLRQHIARWLTDFYHPRDPIPADRICITGGASSNLACILQVFTDPIYTRNVWMVAPTYFLACRMMDDAGFTGRMRGVPEDESGVDLAYLRRELEAAEEKAEAEGNTEPTHKPPRPWGKIYKHIIYAVPTFSNPSTLTMSLSDRESLVRLAREFDALIITDDVYDFLQWSSDPKKSLAHPDKARLPRIVDVDRYLDGGPQDDFGNAVSNGSFSKLIGPGTRTGWAESTEKVAWGISQAGSSRSGGAPSHLAATIIDQLFPTGTFPRFLEESLKPSYARRYYRLMGAIREHLLPLGVTLPTTPEVAGGYFIWVQLPAPLRASELAPVALQEQKVKVATGNLFQVQGDPSAGPDDFNRGVRLCFSWEHEDRLEEGVRRLACAVRNALS
ncbi:aminotransferase-like domain-containing protein [Aspergillus affinis]|uniref:aminotransferase-like domain-containing protein n=1 Tax=Aspergillus affinis TaxID=1070780 RepID=UPI0022FE9025|nr:aromatic amino acid aminotransferase [Aspergillus affinis]KAI9042982.1 aromatic amino acid aminotransferase [Aspergillus affinis]